MLGNFLSMHADPTHVIERLVVLGHVDSAR